VLKKTAALFLSSGMAVLLMTAGTGASLSSPAADLPDQIAKQITKDPAHDYHVKWSPDGKRLAFASLRSGEPKIWLIPAEGGDAAPLETGLSGDHQISWAPDAKRIIFDARWEGVPTIFTISVGGGQPKRINSDRKPDFQPY
jgi:TolB protein